MSWNYQLQDSAKVRFRARTKLMQIIRQDIPERQIRAYNSPKSTWTVHGGRQETNAKYKYKDKKQFNRAKSGWTTKDKDDKRQIQNTKTKTKNNSIMQRVGGRQKTTTTRDICKIQRQNICVRSGFTTECKAKDERRANVQGLQGVGGRARSRAVPAQPARPQRRAAFLSQLCPGAPSYRSLPHKPSFRLDLNF